MSENIVLFLVLLIVGYMSGTIIERRHYKSISQREEEFKSLPTSSVKKVFNEENIVRCELVSGNVVISIDYFKKFLASLVNFFGGNISSYETLIDRARREAILRLKEEAKGASEIVNLKVETSSISKNSNSNIGAVEVLVFATAIYR